MSATSLSDAANPSASPANLEDCGVILCAIYLRISLDRNNDMLAVTRQEEDCLWIAKQRGWRIFKIYTDNSKSAFDRKCKRPAYDEMVADYAAGKFQAIVCYEIDRLTRRSKQMNGWIDAAEKRGLLLVTANGECDLSTPGGREYARGKANSAEAEADKKAWRQKRAALQRAQMGKPPVGRPAFGYDTRGNINEAEAPYLRQIFIRFAGGQSLYSLAEWLEAEGVPPRKGGRHWRGYSVRQILDNPRFCGRVVYNGKVLPGVKPRWTPLIQEELFDRVQLILNDPRRRSSRVGTERKYLGSGLYLCGTCRGRMGSHSGESYRCLENGCMTKAMPKVDEYVRAAVAMALADPDLATKLTPPGLVEQAAEVEARIAGFLRTLAQDRATTEDPTVELTPTLMRSMKVREEKLNAALKLAYAERAAIWAGSNEHPVLAHEDPDLAFLSAPLGQQRQVVDSLFEVVLFTADLRGRKRGELDPTTVQVKIKPRMLVA